MADIENADNSKASESPVPGKTGTYCSLVILVIGFIVSIITQRYAPSYITLDSWNDGCPAGYSSACKASSAVFRVSFALSILFAVQSMVSGVFARFYDILWSLKSGCFAVLVIGFFFASANVFNLHGYAWFARISGFFYLILQQIILIDVAHTWNEKWLEYSTTDGEKGNRWLVGIVVISVLLFSGSISVIGVLFWQFHQCEGNNVIMSLTLCLSFLASIIQLFFSDQGSILTSAIMTAYATYVCYSAVTINPNSYCNPTLDSGYQTVSTVIGLVLTVISLTWTTYTTIQNIPTATNKATGATINLTNIVSAGETHRASASGPADAALQGGDDGYDMPGLKTLFSQISLVFLLISGYYAMILTNWATLQNFNSIANPKTGEAAMWIQAAGQWIAITLYIWSLIAPKLFPDREFN